MAEEVKLLGLWLSPYVLRVKIALKLKGVEYEDLEQEFGSKSEILLKSNPVYKKVPVLIHNGKPICESMIIVQYIDDVWASVGPAIVSSDPYDRAIARFWAVYIDDKCSPSLIGILKGKTEEAKAESAEQFVAGIQLLEAAFEKCSQGKPFFGGDTIGYLDIALGGYLGLIRAVEDVDGFKLLDEAKMPHLARWAERFGSENAVKEVMPDADKITAFVKSSRAK